MTTLLLLPGDGIGPEIVAATCGVLERADQVFGLGLRLEEAEIGFPALIRHGTTIPGAVIDAALKADGLVLGPVFAGIEPQPDDGHEVGVLPMGEGGRILRDSSERAAEPPQVEEAVW